jgi:N-acetylmuramoyl-L-alanine amidase
MNDLIKNFSKIKKINLIPLSLFSISAVCVFLTLAFSSLENSTDKYDIKTVVIDAGHGGKDAGAIGPTGVNEKNVALAVALKLGSKIQEAYPNVKVIYTRKTDVFIELYERANIANRNKADLFISIHLNSSSNPEPHGCEAWVLGLHRSESNLEVAKRENSVIKLEDNNDQNYDLDPNSEAGHIIMSMAQSAYMNQSIDLAGKVVNQFETFANRKVRGVKQAGFMVLYKTAMPSTLIEIGFVSNPEEERYLSSQDGQHAISGSIFNAFKSYKTGITSSIPEKIPVDTEKKIDITTESKTTVNNTEEKKVVEIKAPIETEKKVVEVKKEVVEKVTETINNGATVFRVQFYAAATKAKTGDRPSNAFGTKISYEDNGKGIWRYMTGSFNTMAEARQYLSQVRAKGFADAFIVVYENGVRGDIRKYQ